MEGVISIYDTINCTGKFDLVEKIIPSTAGFIPQREVVGFPWSETMETASVIPVTSILIRLVIIWSECGWRVRR